MINFILVYLLIGVIYTSLLYDIIRRSMASLVMKEPRILPKHKEIAIKYGPLSNIILWPLSIFNNFILRK